MYDMALFYDVDYIRHISMLRKLISAVLEDSGKMRVNASVKRLNYIHRQQNSHPIAR